MLLFPFVNDVLYYEKVETYKLSIRSWLEKNKIFIETSSTIVLIAIAVMASMLTSQTNQIASYQAEIMALEHQPVIEFKIDFVDDPSGEHDRLTISNEGYRLSSFSCQPYVFLYIDYRESGMASVNGSIPLLGYYSEPEITGNGNGRLAILTNPEISGGNKKKADQILTDLYVQRNASGNAHIERYVEVSYNDFFNEPHKEVYFVSRILGGQKLSEEKEREIIQKWEIMDSINLSLYFPNATPDEVYNRFPHPKPPSWQAILNRTDILNRP